MLSNSVRERYTTAGFELIQQGRKLLSNGEKLVEKATAEESVVVLDAYCKDSSDVARKVIDLLCNATKSRFKAVMDVFMWLSVAILCCMSIVTAPDKATVVVSTSLATISGAFLVASFDLYMKRDE